MGSCVLRVSLEVDEVGCLGRGCGLEVIRGRMPFVVFVLPFPSPFGCPAVLLLPLPLPIRGLIPLPIPPPPVPRSATGTVELFPHLSLEPLFSLLSNREPEPVGGILAVFAGMLGFEERPSG